MFSPAKCVGSPVLFRKSPLSFFRCAIGHQRRGRLIVAAREAAPSASCSTATSYTWIWNKTENWCSLCREPCNSWNDHRGKREHICLEMFYNAIVRFNRRWTPASVWWELENTLMRRSSAAAPLFVEMAASEEHGAGAPSFIDFVDAPTSDKLGLSTLLKCYDRFEHCQRRRELFSCLQLLIENGIVRVDRASIGGGASFHGSLVMFKEIFPNVVNMFPHADAKEISALTQMISSTYNSETVFDLCNFRAFLAVDPSSDSPLSGPPLGDEPPAEGSAAHSFHLKGLFCRGVLGQLRWALEPDSVAGPGRAAADQLYWHVLAEHTGRALLAEMVFCRISEYVVRVEGVWRQEGQEVANGGAHTASHVAFHECNEEMERLVSNWGMMKYMDNYFYDSRFGNRLANDGTPKRKRTPGR